MTLRIFQCITLFLLLSGYSLGQESTKRAVILEAAELAISGKTNVSSFNCALKQANLCDTLAMIGRGPSDFAVFDGLEIGFPVADFGCDLMLMTRDFRQLLKSNKYPEIRMRIDKITFEEGHKSGTGGPISAIVTLIIAGELGVEQIRDASIHQIQKKVILTGTHQVLMTRFKIDPPTKMFGAVRTQDLLEIEFAIQIQ